MRQPHGRRAAETRGRAALALAALLTAVLACRTLLPGPRPPTPTTFATLPFPVPTLAGTPPAGQPATAVPGPVRSPSPDAPPALTPGNEATQMALPTAGAPGGQIVYVCFLEGFDNLCLMGADGSNVRRLTNTQATDFYPSLSPDGRQIVFSSRRAGNFDIYLLPVPSDTDTLPFSAADARQLTQGLGSNFGPAISPDGTRVVFASAREAGSEIWVIGLDGQNPKALFAASNSVDPEWSPDGREIAFAALAAGGTTELFVMAADGTSVRQVTTGLNIGGRSDWSPNGQELAVYAGPAGERHIYVVGADGRNLRRLTDRGDNRGPTWSPDGQWIAFASYREGDNEIFAVRVDGSELRQLTQNAWPDWQPRWGPHPAP